MTLTVGRGRLLLTVVLLLAFLLVPASAFGVRKIGLSTGKFEFDVPPGQGGAGEIQVVNDGDERLDVLVYAADQVIGEDGSISFTTPNIERPGEQGPASWLQLTIPEAESVIGNVPYIQLDPGESSAVQFAFTVPADAPPGDHQAVVFFHIREGSAGEEDFSGAQTMITGRLGARITVRVAGSVVQQLTVRPFHIRGLVIGEFAPYAYVLRNGGNVDEDITARLQLLTGDENEQFATTLAEGLVTYAGANLDQNGTVKLDVPPGRYTARLLVEHEAQDGSGVVLTETSDRTIWVIPLWLAILLVVLLGGIALWGSWRASMASAKRSQARAQARRRERQERVEALHARQASLADAEWEHHREGESHPNGE